MKLINNIYHALLWFCGFPKNEYIVDEHISDMLARQKQRLGWVWWFLPISTIVVFLSVTIWLTIHIATFRLKKGDK